MMNVFGTGREATTVRAIELTDVSRLLQLIDTAWRVHLRVPPGELRNRIQEMSGFLAEDWVGLRGFMIMEPQPMDVALIVAAGLRDTWSVAPYLDVLLPEIKQASLARDLTSLVYIGHTEWLVQELQAREFETREWIVVFERLGTQRPANPGPGPAQLRTAHTNDLPVLSALDELVFDHIWHKSPGNFRAALARADSFVVALIDEKIVAYAWCELYGQHAHLTRLAVHPDYQGQGIGAQLLYRSIMDALQRNANLITLNTQEHNLRSQALYQRFGFVRTEERMPILWQDLK